MATQTDNLKRITKRRDQVKKTVTELHDAVLKNTDEFVDASIKTGKKWQKLMDKAVKNSEPLMTKQVDIVFDTIEILKGQVNQGRKRMEKLLGVDTKDLRKAGKKVAAKAQETVKEIRNNPAQAVKSAVRQVEDIVTGDGRQDLKVIEGIGPKMETVLNEAGIRNYADLAKATVPQLKKVLLEANTRYRLMDPAPWIAEARRLNK